MAKKRTPKRKVSIYLDWEHEFLYEIGKPSKLVNWLLTKEFGSDISDDPDKNEKIKINKTLQARKIMLELSSKD